MVKCVFCGREEEAFKGIHFIGNDGNVNYYCSNKCKKNALKLRRDRRKLKWTEAYGIVKSKAVEKQRVKDEKEKSEKKSAENKAEVKK